MPFAAGLALALSAVLNPAFISAPSTPATLPVAQTVEQYVDSYFADVPAMIKVASCESQFRQFTKDGTILQNSKSSAVGVFQIMASIHQDLADQNLGLDIYTVQGNVAYAKYLYDTQGLKPWAASRACWSKNDSSKVALSN